MADEGFHEIQLGKKQLFFIGMAAALYSVVVFSLGVWVGQDVRRPESEIAADAAPDAPAGATPEPTKLAPNELDYAARLQSDGKTPPEPAPAATTEVKPVEPPSPPESEPPPAAKAEAPKTVAAPPAKTEAPKPAPVAAGKNSVMLQVGAFNDGATAQTLADRLKSKGYPAFVFKAASGPLPHKVRVGPLSDKADADKTIARLKTEERLSPFITR